MHKETILLQITTNSGLFFATRKQKRSYEVTGNTPGKPPQKSSPSSRRSLFTESKKQVALEVLIIIVIII